MLSAYLNKIFRRKSYQTNYLSSLPFYNDQEEETKITAKSYQDNPVIHRCVSLIASSASHIPWKLYKKTSQATHELPDHRAALLLKRPAPNCSGADFFTTSISSLLLYGNSYILAANDGKNPPRELYNLPTRQIELVINNDKLTAYKYHSGGSNIQYFTIDPVNLTSRILHLKNYHPTSTAEGLAPLTAAKKSVFLHNEIINWNKSLLKNATRPSGALTFQNGNGYLNEEQFARLKEQFYEGFSGAANSGKPLILEGGLQWQETNNGQNFEKFIELKDSTARDIAIAFNVPPQLLGISGDNTYSNMQEARLALWEENIIPLLDKYADALSDWLSYWFSEQLIVDFDRDAISVLTKRRENLWAKIANANFMTLNEKRAFIGLKPIKGGDALE